MFYLSNFWLVQRGTFNKSGSSLLDEDGIVMFHYMGSSEFQFGAIPKAFHRLLYHYPKYSVFHTWIFTPEHEELMLFCRIDYAKVIKRALRDFIKHPYELQERSELEKIPKVRKNDTSYNRRISNFWWCIDIKKPYGNWIAFLRPQLEMFTEAVENDYRNWCMTRTPEEQEEEYRKALFW